MPDSLILLGDMREQLENLEDNSIDAAITDPPYELGFMGKDWDRSGVAFDPATWALVMRKLKPGAHLAAFGAPRNYHRLAVAIEDAGFEIRDSIAAWLFGTGFPKSTNISKQIAKQRDDKHEILACTALIRKARDTAGITNAEIDGLFGRNGMAGHWTSSGAQPSIPSIEEWEALALFLAERGDSLGVLEAIEQADPLVRELNTRKGEPGEAWTEAPIVGAYEGNTPGFTGERFETRDNLIRELPQDAAAWEGWGTSLKPAYEPIVLARKPLGRADGRAVPVYQNVLNLGTGAIHVGACTVPGAGTDPKAGGWPTNLVIGEAAADFLGEKAKTFPLFHYEPKVRTAERDAGLSHLPPRSGGEMTDRTDGTAGLNSPRAGAGRGGGVRNHHPTVKPIALMRWLVRLLTPPGGVVLDPFVGSGSTGCAVALEGFDFVGCEMDPAYVEIAEARIAHWAKQAEGRAA